MQRNKVSKGQRRELKLQQELLRYTTTTQPGKTTDIITTDTITVDKNKKETETKNLVASKDSSNEDVEDSSDEPSPQDGNTFQPEDDSPGDTTPENDALFEDDLNTFMFFTPSEKKTLFEIVTPDPEDNDIDIIPSDGVFPDYFIEINKSFFLNNRHRMGAVVQLSPDLWKLWTFLPMLALGTVPTTFRNNLLQFLSVLLLPSRTLISQDDFFDYSLSIWEFYFFNKSSVDKIKTQLLQTISYLPRTVNFRANITVPQVSSNTVFQQDTTANTHSFVTGNTLPQAKRRAVDIADKPVITRNAVNALSEPLNKEGVQAFLNTFNTNFSWLGEPSEFLKYIPDRLTDVIGYALGCLSGSQPFEAGQWRQAIENHQITPLEFLQYLLKSYDSGPSESTSLTLLDYSQKLTLNIRDVQDTESLRQFTESWDKVLEQEAQKANVSKEEVFGTAKYLSHAIKNQLKKLKDSKSKVSNDIFRRYDTLYPNDKDPQTFKEFLLRILQIVKTMRNVAAEATLFDYGYLGPTKDRNGKKEVITAPHVERNLMPKQTFKTSQPVVKVVELATKDANVKCFNCNGKGHTSANCKLPPTPKTLEIRAKKGLQDNKKNHGFSSNKRPRKCECNDCSDVNHLSLLSATVDSFYPMIISCNIVSPTLNIFSISLLLDTGARQCYGNQELGLWLKGNGHKQLPSTLTACSPLGQCTNIESVFECNLRYVSELNETKTIKIQVNIFNFSKSNFSLIIGYETIFKYKMVLDFATKFNLESSKILGDEGFDRPVCYAQLQTNSPSPNLSLVDNILSLESNYRAHEADGDDILWKDPSQSWADIS